MSAPLLATKLSIPSVGKHLVDRPYLATKLDECLDCGCRLVLVSAPAGFGKTTLVSAWAAGLKSSEHQLSPSVAWLSLDLGDNDPIIFWTYVISSLQTQRQGIGKQSLSMLQVTTPPDLEGSLASLINELNRIPNPFTLILDDYHFIRNPAIHHGLCFLLERMPSQFHVMVLSRTDPPLPLALLRGRGQLVEIRLNDLRFSTEEANLFLNRGMGLSLPLQAVEALHLKTEGWIAGLQMAALSLREAASLQDHEKVEDFITSFSGSNRYILDYLIEEVLNQQPADIQNFLLRTSILDRLCDPLCDALLADVEGGVQPDSQRILEYLESCNLFVLPLDNQRYWYRYHQLFIDLLRKRLNQMDPGIVAELHRRAIQWYEQNGLIAKAVEHALQVKDFHKAASLVSLVAEELWGRGEHVTLLGWIDALPEEERRQYPHLWIWQVSMLIAGGKIHEAEHHIPEIENYLSSSPAADDDQTSIMGRVYSLRTYVASFYGDIPNLLHYAHLALKHLTREEDARGRCGISLVLSNAYINKGDLEAAGQALSEAVEAGKISQRPYMALTAMSNLAIVLYAQGDLRRASQVCQEGIQSIQQNGLQKSPLAANLFVGEGIILCERHELDEAERYIRRGLELARERSYIWSIAWGYRALIRWLLACNSLAAAESAAQEAEGLVSSHEIPAYHTCGISGLKVKVWIRLGKIELAERYLQDRKIQVDGGIEYPHETEYWALASLCLAKDDLESAANLLERMLLQAESVKQQLWVIRTLVLQALLYQIQGNRQLSLQTLGRALELAEPQGYVQTFVDEGEPMVHLLREAIKQDIHPQYASILRLAFLESAHEVRTGPAVLVGTRPVIAPESGSASSGPAQPGKDALVEPLTGREMEVLQLIAEGYSNKEIAQRLYVSLRTVKYYATNIYAKLGVVGRTQAAFRAREMGLL
jgi:LuxR family maltose regulon positive regulatory protein